MATAATATVAVRAAKLATARLEGPPHGHLRSPAVNRPQRPLMGTGGAGTCNTEGKASGPRAPVLAREVVSPDAGSPLSLSRKTHRLGIPKTKQPPGRRRCVINVAVAPTQHSYNRTLCYASRIGA
jgi:hypothetical protein